MLLLALRCCFDVQAVVVPISAFRFQGRVISCLISEPSRGTIAPWLTGLIAGALLLEFQYGIAAVAVAPGHPLYYKLIHHYCMAYMAVVTGFIECHDLTFPPW